MDTDFQEIGRDHKCYFRMAHPADASLAEDDGVDDGTLSADGDDTLEDGVCIAPGYFTPSSIGVSCSPTNMTCCRSCMTKLNDDGEPTQGAESQHFTQLTAPAWRINTPSPPKQMSTPVVGDRADWEWLRQRVLNETGTFHSYMGAPKVSQYTTKKAGHTDVS